MISDQTVVPSPAEAEVPMALIATTVIPTPFAGPLPGVVTSHTATGHEVVENTAPVPEVMITL